MTVWGRAWWGTAALVVLAEAALLRLDRLGARAPVQADLGAAGTTQAWFGLDTAGHDTMSRVIYGLPEAWSVVGLVLLAVSVALGRGSRLTLAAAPFALVAGLLPAHLLGVSAALVATAVLAAAAARSTQWRVLRLTTGLGGAVVLLLLTAGAGRPGSTVEQGSTAELAGRAVVTALGALALLLLLTALVPGARSRTAEVSVETRVRSAAWAVVAVAAAVHVAVVGAQVVGQLPTWVHATAERGERTITVAIAQFTTAQPQRTDLFAVLGVVAILSAAAAAVAATLLRSVHPLVRGAVACFVLAVLPVGIVARSCLASAGFAILGFVAVQAPETSRSARGRLHGPETRSG